MEHAKSSDEKDEIDERTLVLLREMARRYPDEQAVLERTALLRARLTLPKGTIHIVSDVHGEAKKLEHIIRNASGSLRPLVEKTVAGRLDAVATRALLNLIYYPQDTWNAISPAFSQEDARRRFVRTTLRIEFDVLRALCRNVTVSDALAVLPDAWRTLFREALLSIELGRGEAYLDALFDPFLDAGRDLEVLRHAARAIRNLSVSELIVAGDLGDRGPRIDRVIETLMHQPSVSFTWGNHDASWMGACLGQRTCIATVARISLRYRRLSQLEEGYGIPFAPVEKLARTMYGDDPAERFPCKGEGLRDPLLMARMQKAMAIIQWKVEGQLLKAHPEWRMEERALLLHVDPKAGTVTIDGRTHPLLDRAFPTVDWNDPLRLSPEEDACLSRLRQSFMQSQTLWDQMSFVARRGSMWLLRDDHAIFHGCIPVDDSGAFLPFPVRGTPRSGRALLDAFEHVMHEAFRDRRDEDLDLLWYLWSGPLSPCFGKDRMATFETHFVADKDTYKETKNPYFRLIHEAPFCERVLKEFGADPARGLIVNGHVPVRVEAGESPLKRSGLAVTIDGAFSEAYGDRGYTLVLEAGRTFLAQHHHFESVADAIATGADIIPVVENVRVFDQPRTIADTEEGDAIGREIGVLDLLRRVLVQNLLTDHSS